jgi:tetratricopeptide (TPR) repeat protein
MRHQSQLIRLRILLVVVSLIGVLAPPSTGAFKYLREGMTTPGVVGTDLVTNEPVRTDQWLGDNMVVVIFWASWSERSIKQLKDVASFINDHPDLNCKVVAVNVDAETLSPAEKSALIENVKSMNLPYPVVQDEGLEIFYKYGAIAVPSTAIIDTTGTLRYAPSGYSLTTRDRIEDSINVLLGLLAPAEDVLADQGYRPTNQASRYCGMAVNQIGRKQYRRALKNLDLAEKADSGFAQPHILRGEVFLAMDSVLSAVESFTRAVALDSGSVVAWTGLGVSHLRSKHCDSAWPELTNARQLDENYTPAMFSLGLCLAERGDLAAAIDSLNWARDLNERDPLTHYYLGKVHLKAGNTAEAVNAYKTSLEILFPAK